MTTSTLDVRRDGHVARVYLNRPDVRNAFNEGVIAELTRCSDEWARHAARSGWPALGRKASTGTAPFVAALTLASRSMVAFCSPFIRRYSVMRLTFASAAILASDIPGRLAYSMSGWFSISPCNTGCTNIQ